MDDSLSRCFYDEAGELIEQMDATLLALESGGGGPDSLDSLFRNAHSLKGNSAAMGFTHMSRFTHALESVLDAARKGRQLLTKEVAAELLRATTALRDCLESSRTVGDVGHPQFEAILGALRALAGKRGAAPNAKREWTITFPSGQSLGSHSDPLRALSELARTGRITECMVTDDVPPLNALNSEVCSIGWTLTLTTDQGEERIRAALQAAWPQARYEILPYPEAVAEEHAPATVYRVRFTPGAKLIEEADPLRTLAELAEYATIGTCSFESGVPPLDKLMSDSNYGQWELVVATQYAPAIIRAVLELSSEDAQVEIGEVGQDLSEQTQTASVGLQTGTSSDGKGESRTVRVSAEKVDALFNLVTEIVIAQSMLSNALPNILDENAKLAIEHLEHHVRELHERIMAVRMVPVGSVFSRFPRLVRDVSAAFGKEIRLAMSGEATELDRAILEALTDPLAHVLRNCCDHGIENLGDRVASGKPSCGTISLSASQSEGCICIEVADDGRGIDLEKVLDKARSLGWIADGATPSTEALCDMLFRPGFTTADAVSVVSGRGVGMDVVKRNLEALGGTASIWTEAGVGTRITLKVPLTVAIVDGLSLQVGDEVYVVPLRSVIEAFRSDSVTLCEVPGRRVVSVRGHFIPVVRLGEMVGCANSLLADGLVVVVEHDDQKAAVIVDAIAGQSQVALKGFEVNFGAVDGIAGAAIAGDGRVVLMLDVRELVRQANSRSSGARAA